jgi:hypothetical protein
MRLLNRSCRCQAGPEVTAPDCIVAVIPNDGTGQRLDLTGWPAFTGVAETDGRERGILRLGGDTDGHADIRITAGYCDRAIGELRKMSARLHGSLPAELRAS